MGESIKSRTSAAEAAALAAEDREEDESQQLGLEEGDGGSDALGGLTPPSSSGGGDPSPNDEEERRERRRRHVFESAGASPAHLLSLYVYTARLIEAGLSASLGLARGGSSLVLPSPPAAAMTAAASGAGGLAGGMSGGMPGGSGRVALASGETAAGGASGSGSGSLGGILLHCEEPGSVNNDGATAAVGGRVRGLACSLDNRPVAALTSVDAGMQQNLRIRARYCCVHLRYSLPPARRMNPNPLTY